MTATTLLTWILIVGCAWIAGHWLWLTYKQTDDVTEEGFQAWSQSLADKKARVGHSCAILDRFEDIEIVEDSCEDGLPHTTDADTIRIPRSMWETASPTTRETTLRHERIHLDQRRRPSEWATFYRDAWGYTVSPTPPASIPPDVLETVRGNPDTWPARWAIWRGRYCFVPTYADLHAPRVRNAETRVWDLQTRSWAPRPAAWEAFFCQSKTGQCVYQSEHPAEISAEMGASLDLWGATTAAGISLQNFMRSSKLLPEQ
jgi:hypothetical protein